ncbi:MAG TPA: hypothetical protein VK989_17255 [Polyangia bacterium]|jgi:hypothetical protein|nr:hypothetical protein [Polyangia bacterium]
MTAPSEPRAASHSYLIVALALAVVVAVIVFVGRSGPSAGPGGVEPALATIDIGSSPSGATVNRVDGGAIVGVTPMTVTFPRSQTDLLVVVKHAGYQDHLVTIPVFSETGRVDVILTPNGVDAGAAKPLPKNWSP